MDVHSESLNINFLKIQKYVHYNLVSDFEQQVGVSLDDWENKYNISKEFEHIVETENFFENNKKWLKNTAELFNVNPRIFLHKTLKFVLTDLIEKSWDSNKLIDEKHIIPEKCDDLILNEAECILLYEGSQTGTADCSLTHEKYEYDFYEGNKNERIIRSEILEWLLNPAVSKLLIKSGGITIINATIIYGTPFTSAIKKTLGHFKPAALRIEDSILNVDLTFKDCVFDKDVIFDNSIIQSLSFDKCNIDGDFSARNIVSNGDIRFTAHNRSQGQNIPDEGILRLLKKKTIESDIYGSIILAYANINGNFECNNGFLLGGVLDADYIQCSHIICSNINIQKPKRGIEEEEIIKLRNKVALSLTGAKVTGTIDFQGSVINGAVVATNLKSDFLIMQNSIIHSTIEFLYSTIGIVNLAGAQLLGKGCSLDAPGLNANAVFLTDSFLALHGVQLHKSVIKDLYCTDGFFGTTSNNQSLVCSGSKILFMYLNNTICIGTVFLANSIIETKINFDKGIFIANGNKRAIDCENITIGKKIGFYSKEEVDKRNSYVKDPEARATYLEQEIGKLKRGEGNYWDLVTEYGRLGAIIALKKEHNESFKVLDDVALLNDYDERYAVVIGEASFESADINGRMDCAGALFYTKVDESFFKEDSLVKLNAKLNNSVLGKFLIVVLAFLPALFIGLIKCFLMVKINLFYRMGKIDVNRKRQQIKKLKHILVDNYLAPKKENWPNALTLSHTRINGDLFLNSGHTADAKSLPFKAIGEVDLQSAKIDNFFISPDTGGRHDTRWKITGLKYDFIYASDDKYERIEDCRWFFDYVDEDNFRQPYEQLAASYLKMGDDTNARKVLMQTPGRRYGEKCLMAILSLIAWMALPPYRALLSLFVLWAIGATVFTNALKTGEIVPAENRTEVQYSAGAYSVQLLVPFISSPQKESFKPSNNNEIKHPIYFSYRPDFIPSIVPRQINFPFYAYHTLHSLLGTILVSLFLLGIARIIRNV